MLKCAAPEIMKRSRGHKLSVTSKDSVVVQMAPDIPEHGESLFFDVSSFPLATIRGIHVMELAKNFVYTESEVTYNNKISSEINLRIILNTDCSY